MSDTGHLKCPRCGKELTAAAPEGLCPACLGALNFATDTALPEADAKETLPPLTPTELAPHFPQLEILECLGRGGMGVVYKARQKSLNRFIALKLLAPERVQDAKFAERFAREAHALAALNHPSIVTVHDFGQAGGFYFLLMEFVDGVNLRQLLRSRKLQPSEALAIVPPVCEALQYAHEHGIVHRDIKPENLLLAKDGRVKIADFGIAKMLGSDSSIPSISLSSLGGEGRGEEATGTSVTQHTTMGTPQYMAPEQRDQSQSADHRADIYSLGVVLYELLTGELPADKLQPPSRVRGVQIDVRLDEIVLRALEKTPELRYQTADEFKTQVESVAVKPPEKNAPEEEGALSSPPNRGPLPRALKAIICWLLVQGGLALALNLFNFISWGQVQVNLIGLNLAAGFGLMTLRTGWWRFALVMNGAQMLSSLLGVPLALASASTWTRFLSPMEAFRTQPVFLAIWVLMQVVTITTCVLVHFNLLRLRREGWFGPVAEEQKKIEYAIATVTFYTGIILGIVIIGLMPFRFSRDAAYLVIVGIMVALSPLVGMFIGNALRQAEREKQTVQLTRIRRWLTRLSIVAWTLALPVAGFGIFLLFGSLSKVSGWNPATSEAVLIPLTWLGSMLLPWAAISLRSTPVKNVNRVWQIAGLLTLICLSLGLGLRQYEGWQKDARRMVAERDAVASSAPAMVDRAVDHSPFIAHLPNGGSVELLAVRLQSTPTNEPWWKPDGTPSSYGGDITMEGMPKSDGGVLGLLKVTWPKTSTNTTGFSMDAGRFALKNGLRQPIEELRIEHFDRAIAINDTTILSLETGVREWQTVMSFKPGLADYIFGGKRHRQWEISETTAGNLKVACNKLFRLPGNEYSLAVIDKKGNRWAPSSFRITTTTGQLEGEYEASFDGIGNENTGRVNLQDVEEIRWQMRPYDSIQFQNVSLQPGKHTQVSINEFVSETTPSSLTANSVVPPGGRLEFNISNAEVTKQKPLFLALEKNAKYYAPISVYFSAAGVVEQTRSATDWLTTNDVDLVSWSVPGLASLSGINLQGSAGVDKLIFDDLQDNSQSDYWSILGWNKNFVYQERTDRERGPSYWVLRTAKGKIIMLEVSSSEVNGGQLSIRYRFGKQPESKENKTQSSNPPQPVVSSMSNAVPVWPLILPFLFLGLGIGGLVLIIWLSRKKGLKGCLLAGAIMLGVIAGVVVLVALVSYSSRAKAFRVTSQPLTRFELESINQQPVPSEPNGLAMQVQNGLNVRVPGGQLATFEFYMRQPDDTLELIPALTAVIATSPSGSFNGSIFWQGKRGDEARGANQHWFWSVNGHTLGGQPLPSRPDYETNVTYHLRRDEVLNWWQLNLPSLTTMSLGETRDIPIFRTFGTATIHGDQPKEAIVRVKCETLPADFKIDAGQYQLLFGTKHNQPAGTDDAEVNPAALPRSLVPQSVVDEARAEAKRAAALFGAARTTRTEVIAAEYHLKWAEAMFNGDVRGALQAKRDEAALKLESIDSLMKTGRMSNTDRAKAVRELTETEAALKQWDLKAAK